MSEKQQIEEIASLLCGLANSNLKNSCNKCEHRFGYICQKSNFYAEQIYKADYRKKSDVVKEFAEVVKALLNKYEYRSHTDGVSFYQMNAESFCDELDELVIEFSAEVQK